MRLLVDRQGQGLEHLREDRLESHFNVGLQTCNACKAATLARRGAEEVRAHVLGVEFRLPRVGAKHPLQRCALVNVDVAQVTGGLTIEAREGKKKPHVYRLCHGHHLKGGPLNLHPIRVEEQDGACRAPVALAYRISDRSIGFILDDNNFSIGMSGCQFPKRRAISRIGVDEDHSVKARPNIDRDLSRSASLFDVLRDRRLENPTISPLNAHCSRARAGECIDVPKLIKLLPKCLGICIEIALNDREFQFGVLSAEFVVDRHCSWAF